MILGEGKSFHAVWQQERKSVKVAFVFANNKKVLANFDEFMLNFIFPNNERISEVRWKVDDEEFKSIAYNPRQYEVQK
jgi:hypothetical protein